MALMREESIGGLSLGMEDSQVAALLGEPEEKTEPEVWGFDGLEHMTWNYGALGADIGFVKEGETFTVSGFSVYEPFAGQTARGVGVGSDASAVQEAYQDTIFLSEQHNQGMIVVGSVYGGLIFTLEDSKVIGIFVGASAE